MNEADKETAKTILERMDKTQDQLRKEVVHSLRGVDPGKISTKKFDDAMSVAKRVSDSLDKDIKRLKKLLK